MLDLLPNTSVDDSLVSDFLPKALFELMYANKMKVDVRKIIKIDMSKADYASMALSVAKIGTDLWSARKASFTNELMTDKLIARL